MVKLPIMPIYQLSMDPNCNFHFENFENYEPSMMDSTIIRKKIDLTIEGVGTFTGLGRTKRLCKISAAKKYLNWKRNHSSDSV